MSKIKNIVFDVGGVFIIWDPHAYFGKFFASKEETESFLKEIDFDSMNYWSDKGKPVKEIVKEQSLIFPQYKDIISGYYKNWAVTITGEIAGTVDLTLALKKAGYKIYGLSNFERRYFDITDRKYNFAKYFDGLIISSDVKAVKPEEDIYKILLETYNLKAQECVFLDDRAENIETAEKLGFKGIVFKDPQDAQKELEKLGVSVKMPSISI